MRTSITSTNNHQRDTILEEFMFLLMQMVDSMKEQTLGVPNATTTIMDLARNATSVERLVTTSVNARALRIHQSGLETTIVEVEVTTEEGEETDLGRETTTVTNVDQLNTSGTVVQN